MQEILGLVRRCVEDYDMIQSGDTVAVGVSGGKDSLLTLTALARLSRFYPKPFRVVAMTIEAGTPGMSFDGVADYCHALGVEYIRVSVPIYEVVFLERREKNPCSLCAKLRRGALSTAMNEHGIRKIALGHHYDDAIETLLMNLLFEGRIGCFQPVTYLDRSGITQIRPLLYCREDEVCRVVEELQRHTHLLFSLESMHNLAQNGRISKLAATAAGVLGIRAVGQASAEGTLEMLGKCRGERKTQEFLLQEMERLGYKGGSVRIGHCGNAAFSLELYTELRRRFPNADVRRYPLRGLCSYYAERGGVIVGFETM